MHPWAFVIGGYRVDASEQGTLMGHTSSAHVKPKGPVSEPGALTMRGYMDA